MISALTSFYRSIQHHRLFALLNIGGLALGIAVFLTLYLFVTFEMRFDRALPGWDRIWVVERELSIPGVPSVSIPSSPEMLTQLQADYPEQAGARMNSDDVAVRNGAETFSETLASVDPAYFDLFEFPVIAGNPRQAMEQPGSAVITQHIAAEYFGSSALGQTLSYIQNGEPHQAVVRAIIEDMPEGLTFRHEIFVPMPATEMIDRVTGRGVTTFLQFTDNTAAGVRAAQLPAFTRRHPDPTLGGAKVTMQIDERLTPLADLHLSEAEDRTVVVVLGIVGLLALIIAIFNYVNLETARAALRAREVALRKVVGASRRALIAQFIGETLLATALAALIGLALAEVALPFVNQAGGTSLSIRYVGAQSILLPALVLILLVGVLAGLYPAFVLSRFGAAGVLASSSAPMGGRASGRLRQTLVVLQFAIAIALMACTGVLVAQTRHLQTSDLGFNRDGLITVPAFADPSLGNAQRQAVKRSIAALPGVLSMSESAVAPSGGSFSIGPVHRQGSTASDPNIIEGVVSDQFFETYQTRLLAGRTFAPERFALDDAIGIENDPKRPLNIVINQSASIVLGFESPSGAVGAQAEKAGGRPVTIIGVVADMRFRSPREPVDPTLYTYQSGDMPNPVLTIRYKGAKPEHVMGQLESAWRKAAPTVPFDANTVDGLYYKIYYQSDAQRSRLFTIGAMMAILIGCIGLYGLAAFEAARRTREIGIRKVLGASTRDITRLLIGQFLRPVLIANLIAWPLAWFAMRQWLAGFDDRVALSPWFFIGASIVASAIAMLTIFAQVLRVARARPAHALRHE